MSLIKMKTMGFINEHMCSPAIATQAEDLIAGGVKELIHIGFAGGLQIKQKPGDLVLIDGAFNDTAVARLYGFDYEKIDSTKILTDELERKLVCKNMNYRRGVHKDISLTKLQNCCISHAYTTKSS